MSIRVLMAAAAVAVGVGQAEAATVVSYDLTMRYEGTTYTDLTVIDYGSNGDDWQDYYFESLVAETTSIALPTLRDGLKIGAEVVFSALLTVPDDPYNYDSWPGAFDNGGRAIRCEIAGTDCVTGLTATFPEQNIGFGEYRSMSFGDSVGDKFYYTFNTNNWSSLLLDWGRIHFFNRTATFSILSYNSTVQPAPVPLPASVALLPLGLGAFAMMRKRRRPR